MKLPQLSCALRLVISVLLVFSAATLLAFAGIDLVHAVMPFDGRAAAVRIDGVLGCIASLMIAVASLVLGQTIVEEEIRRVWHMSSPSRVRHFRSRLLVLVVVALSIAALVGVFRFGRDDPSKPPLAAAIGLMAAALPAGWGVFIRMNLGAEEVEPEARVAARQGDHKAENPV